MLLLQKEWSMRLPWVAIIQKIWFNRDMNAATQTQGKIEQALRHEVESLQNLVKSQSVQLQQQQQTIDELEQQLLKRQERITQLEEELRDQKKLKGRPKIRASQLNKKKKQLRKERKKARFSQEEQESRI